MSQSVLAIRSFSGEHVWLLSFYSCSIEFEGQVFPSVENAYQAAKSLSLQTRESFQRLQANKAKVLRRSVLLRPD